MLRGDKSVLVETRRPDAFYARLPAMSLENGIDIREVVGSGEGGRIDIEDVKARARRVLITTPWGFRPQEIPGMPFETHRSGWYPWEFRQHCTVHRWQAFPGHFTKHLRLPRLWQLLVVVGKRGA